MQNVTESVIFTHDSYEDMIKHAMDDYPDECCGILLGSEKTGAIECIRRAVNSAEAKLSGKSFRIDPIAVRDIELEAQKRGLDFIGFYHSHPDKAAILSASDKEQMIPFMLYLVISVTAGGCGDIKGYVKGKLYNDIIYRCVGINIVR